MSGPSRPHRGAWADVRVARVARTALVGALAVALVAGPVAGAAAGTVQSAGPGTAGARPGTAAAVRADVPLPVVEPITGPTSPMTAALQDLRKAGYVEREFRVTLTDPQVYAYTGTGTEVSAAPAPSSPQGAYRTRIIVRSPPTRPGSPAGCWWR